MTGKLFDLNMEEVLENWEVPHAVREIIANVALPLLSCLAVTARFQEHDASSEYLDKAEPNREWIGIN